MKPALAAAAAVTARVFAGPANAALSSTGRTPRSGRRPFGVLALALALAGTCAVPASADTVDFSDLGPGCTPTIPDPYHGLTWSPNLQPLCDELYATDYGNTYGTLSGWAVHNGSEPGAGISTLTLGSGTFAFGGALFSSFAENDQFAAFSALSLQLLGYLPGDDPDRPTYFAEIGLDTQYVLESFAWTGLSMLLLAAGNGPVGDVATIYGGDGLSWLMTDVRIETLSVPDPAPGTLVLLGVWFLLGAVRRRRRAGQAG